MIERALNLSLCHKEQVLNDNQHDLEVFVGCENQDEESAIMVVIFALDVMLCAAYPRKTHEDGSLKSEKQNECKGVLYQSLKEEMN
ncbi:hypothetical protein V6N13_063814 [Hibiscus sabdariffa]